MVIAYMMCVKIWEVYGFKLHIGKCRFFQSQVEYLSHMIYSRGLEVQKAKAYVFSKVLKPTNVS
jgi:hypothetical protein